MKTGPGKKE
jgi:hypothetical protein